MQLEHTIIQAKISVPSQIGTSWFALKNMQATELPLSWLFQHYHQNHINQNQVNSETLAKRHLPPPPTQELRTGEFTRNTAKGSTEQTWAPSTGHRLKSSAISRSLVQIVPDLSANKLKHVNRLCNYPGFQPALPHRSMGTPPTPQCIESNETTVGRRGRWTYLDDAGRGIGPAHGHWGRGRCRHRCRHVHGARNPSACALPPMPWWPSLSSRPRGRHRDWLGGGGAQDPPRLVLIIGSTGSQASDSRARAIEEEVEKCPRRGGGCEMN
jgi:hypothetical protein